jgi:hypothetical protein
MMTGEGNISSSPARQATPRDQTGSEQTFFRFTDQSGRIVIVDSKDKLPKSAQANAQRLELSGAAAGTKPPSEADLSLPSLGLGVALGIVCTVGTLFLFRRAGAGFIAKVFGGLAIAALLGGLYLGWLTRATGQSDQLLSSPADIIDNARRTVEQANESRRKQHQLLEDLADAGK